MAFLVYSLYGVNSLVFAEKLQRSYLCITPEFIRVTNQPSTNELERSFPPVLIKDFIRTWGYSSGVLYTLSRLLPKINLRVIHRKALRIFISQNKLSALGLNC